jgi:DNA-binding NtrC family response regulator
MRKTLLVLEPPGADLSALREALKCAAGDWAEVSGVRSLSMLADADAAFVDYAIGDGTRAGAEVIRDVREKDADLPLVAVAERGDVHVASEAIAAGASDFLVRSAPLGERVATLLEKLRRLMALVDAQKALRSEDSRRFRIVTRSPQMAEVLERVSRVSRIPRPVLIVGERGTGKELVARAIHQASGRAASIFLAINCAALTETLLESELFGHEKGAFTGADRATPGKFELAKDGTLFLDEIGHMPLSFQQKILRVVEYGTYTRVGGSRELTSTARLVAATNMDLEPAMREGRFLRDLHDRLAFETVHVPPLRERDGDLELLSEHFLAEFLREVPALGRKTMSADAYVRLRRYAFPGNVRELKHVIERAAYRDTTSEINAEDIGPLDGGGPAVSPDGTGFEARVEAYKKQLVADALAASEQNQAEAARRLGLSYDQIRYYCQKYELGRRKS